MSVPIVLGPPPEFGSGGTPPPVASDPMTVATWRFTIDTGSSELFAVEPAHLARSLAIGVVFPPALLLFYAKVGVKLLARRKLERGTLVSRSASTSAEREQRQLLYSQRWRRDDPVVQLPPGVKSEKSYTVTTGIEQSRSLELSRSLGVKTASPRSLSSSVRRFVVEFSERRPSCRAC
jgi:hypothetical protein